MKLTKAQSRAMFADAAKAGTTDLRDMSIPEAVAVEVAAPARPRPIQRTTKGMNKTEARYESEVLKPLLRRGKIRGYHFERFKYKIGIATCWYTPDFLVVWPDRLQVVEIKGFWEDDALVKFKAAADLYDYMEWIAVQYKQGAWVEWNPHEGGR